MGDLFLGDGCLLMQTPGHTSGNQTLFVHADEVEQSWKLYTPLLENPGIIHRYRSGSWGPREAEHLAIPETELWQI